MDDDAPLCPQCGYDLRGADSGRCSECGLEIDRAALLTSNIPWTQRQRIGRIRAYLWTVWLVTLGGRRIAHEASKPQSPADARWFGWITAGWVGVVFVGVFFAAVAAEEGLAFMAIQPEPAWAIATARPAWLDDLAVPWCAGATIPPMMPIALALFAWSITTAPRRLFHVAGAGPKRRERAEAMALYATAPLFLLVPAAIVLAAVSRLNPTEAFYPLDRMLPVGIGLLEAAAFVLTIARVAQWLARVKHSTLAGLAGIPLLLGLWSLAGIILLGILPWCIGLLWIIIDSFL